MRQEVFSSEQETVFDFSQTAEENGEVVDVIPMNSHQDISEPNVRVQNYIGTPEFHAFIDGLLAQCERQDGLQSASKRATKVSKHDPVSAARVMKQAMQESA